MVWNILANILAFVSFIAMLNAIIGWFGVLVGLEDMSFEVRETICYKIKNVIS